MKKFYSLIALSLIIISTSTCKKGGANPIGGYDTYVLGVADNGKSVYWKNSISINVQPVANATVSGHIRVFNGDVYIPGNVQVNDTLHAFYSKNGMVTDL